MSLLIIYSMTVDNLDRFFNSDCGWKCGYMLDKKPKFFNPLDYILRRLSSHHERFYNIQLFLDTLFFSLILFYTFICLLYGIIKIGINFFSLEIYRIRRRDTMPQALSIVSILVILMMFAFSMQLMSIAPVYVTFGDQKQANGEGCTLKDTQKNPMNAIETGCQMTVISQLYTKILLTLPLFSLIYFIQSWLFVIFSIMFLVYHAFYKRQYQSSNL